MDFRLSQDQQDIQSLAKRILSDLAVPDGLPDMEEAVEWHDPAIWRALAEAGLLGVAVPEKYGGMGFGWVELCVLIEQVGAAVAPVPVLPSLAMGAALIAEFGSAAQCEAYLPAVCRGEILLSAALAESESRDPLAPLSTAERDAEGWRLSGEKICVPLGRSALRILVPARDAGGAISIFLVDPRGCGLSLERQESTAGELQYRMVMRDLRVDETDRLAGRSGGGHILQWLVEHATAALCALELGVVGRALEMTAKYTGERHQFGKPIATFQAVAQRAADAYIDVEAIRLSTWQAVWRLAQGLDATREVSIAKYWASAAGHRASYAAQHLHGGIGMDKDYPLHRYYVWSRQIELTLGGAHTHLAKLGRMLATG